MHIRHEFPHRVCEIEHTLIPLKDGTRLAARIWLPEDAEQNPVPAILEYLPYRKLDGTAVRDALTHPYLAGHGYACVRVDIRGNGESDGLMLDEYLQQEQDDALEVIDWISRQPWCSGKLGMMGISWGGFNSLQLAARRPAPLKAIITLCSTDDRYADDVHFKGGNLLLENLGWAATMLSFSAAVPDPRLVGDDWLDRWKYRLENMPLLAHPWVEHGTRDGYWQHGSICENYADIEAAVYCIGGWGDAYRNTPVRMMEHLTCPKKALIGPWIHKYPHFAIPDPAIGFLQEALRWWDHWLKDIDTGIMDEPECTFYLQEAQPPVAMSAHRAGDWVQTDAWPAREVNTKTFSLADGGLCEGEHSLTEAASICSPLTTGVHGGEYCAIWFGPDFPTDQRRDDAQSLCFDSAPLREPLSLLGNPRVRLTGAVDQDCGQVTVRLSDVAPDGRATLVSYGTLNLSLRHDRAQYTPPVPGENMAFEVVLDNMGYKVPAGHRLRVAIATAHFPLLWPSRKLTTLTLAPGTQQLLLPVFEGEPIDNPFQPPESAPPVNMDYLREPAPKRTITEDVASGEVCLRVDDDMGTYRFLDHGFWVEQKATEEYRTRPYDPDATRADIEWLYRAGRDDWQVRVESRLSMTGDEHYYYLSARQQAWLNDEPVNDKHWDYRIPRRAQ